MNTFKIYGEDYALEETSAESPDAYAYRGALYDNLPPGKVVGYVTMPDGSLIECYYQRRKSVLIIPIICVIIVLLIVLGYFVFLQPKDVIGPGGLSIKQGTDKDVVSYNGFMAIEEGNLSVNFQNGSEIATITVEGDGITADTIQVQPEEFVASIPATFTTDSGLVQAKLIITTETSTSENEVVVEIPENNTGNSSDTGLEGYWKGEYIYGTDIDSAE